MCGIEILFDREGMHMDLSLKEIQGITSNLFTLWSK